MSAVLRPTSTVKQGAESSPQVVRLPPLSAQQALYDPRSYLKKAEAGMTERVIEACNDLHSSGRSVSAG